MADDRDERIAQICAAQGLIADGGRAIVCDAVTQSAERRHQVR